MYLRAARRCSGTCYLEEESKGAQLAWRRRRFAGTEEGSWKVHREGLYFLSSVTVLHVLPLKELVTARGCSNTGKKPAQTLTQQEQAGWLGTFRFGSLREKGSVTSRLSTVSFKVSLRQLVRS